MPGISTLVSNTLEQRDDHQAWAEGINTITFDYPFSDIDYKFIATAPGLVVTEVDGSRTTTGLQVLVTGGSTDQGFFEASGATAQFASQVGALASGADITVVKGVATLNTGGQTVQIGTALPGTDYQLMWKDVGVGIVEDIALRTNSTFYVTCDDDDVRLEFTVIYM